MKDIVLLVSGIILLSSGHILWGIVCLIALMSDD